MESRDMVPGIKITAVKDGARYSAGQQYFIHANNGELITLGWAGLEKLRELRISRAEVETNFEESKWQN